MTSLWNLLFSRPHQDTYVRLDAEGNCLGFMYCTRLPSSSSGWVQVSEAQLG
ncbi:hypothetical protein [Pseudomonas guariconensis]|uniref:hypothetical protein n=1 Tax=Pseudomonas guariconensis TaxID=1288410 RepID=UPI003AF31A9A